MSALTRYEAMCTALSDAASVQEVLTFHQEMEHVKLHGRMVKDRRLIAKATVEQTKAERRLGELLTEAERLGWIGQGRPSKSEKTVPGEERFTLAEAGIDRKVSARAQKLAKLPEDEFERGLEDVHERIIAGGATAINGARAIMSFRQEPDDSLDYFPTPPWATRALMEHALGFWSGPKGFWNATVWEPACGEGHIAEVLGEYFGEIRASDIHDYGFGDVVDFLDIEPQWHPDWIITNPPFGDKALQFVHRALDFAVVGVAMFFRSQWAVEGVERYESLFRDKPPTCCAFFIERVNLCKGRWDPDGTTATAYCWLIWVKNVKPRAPFWIPPGQRAALTYPDDAERFTAHPVKPRNESIDPSTGEILSGEAAA